MARDFSIVFLSAKQNECSFSKKGVFMKRVFLISLTAILMATSQAVVQAAAPPDDRGALLGVKTGKGVFDINTTEVDKLTLYLQVIKETQEGLKKQRVKPDLIVAFRGASVRFVSKERGNFTTEEQENLLETDEMISELSKEGVRFEACAIATRLYNINNKSILPAVRVVGNTFISLIGYQSKGYNLIPIY